MVRIRRVSSERRERPESKREYGERMCIRNCGSQQRECQAEAVKAFRTATKECRDGRIPCITECKKPPFPSKDA